MPDLSALVRPNFERPPVVETVLSVQFERLAAMRAVHFGSLWRKLKPDFQKTEERHALEPVIERFTGSTPHRVRLQFEAVETLPLPRLWLLNDAGDEMVQVQNDRFVKNWRKSEGRQAYPRYDQTVRPAFERDWELFKSFVAEEGLGEIKVNQCEVTYVNHIVSGDGWEEMGEIGKIFTFWKQPAADGLPGHTEDFGFQARFQIRDEKNAPIGRLHVDVQPALNNADKRPMYVMTLTARGMCGNGVEFLDVGRLWVVNSFTNLTTQNMHAVWGRKE